MYTGIVFTKDTRLVAQLDAWCKQHLAGHLRIEGHASLESYKDMITKASAAAAVAEALKTSGSDRDRVLIRIFMIDGEFMDKKPDLWIGDIQKMTKELGANLTPLMPTVLFMGYETGPLRPGLNQFEAIDDMILKPVDKAVFLQKVEFLTAEASGKVTPSFLFRAKTEQAIEAGRDVVIDEVSEFAVGVRSPGPIPDGAFASIHCDLFGERGARRLIGRAYESIKHPVREGEFLVHFSYFGLSAEQLNTIRRYIRNNQAQVRPKSLSTGTAGAGSGAAGGMKLMKPALSKQLQEKMSLLNGKKLAVIDLNMDSLSELKAILESSFKYVNVKAFPSYARFAGELQKLLKPTASEFANKPPVMQSVNAPIAANPNPTMISPAQSQPALPGGKPLAVLLKQKSHDLLGFEPEMRPKDLVLGKSVGDWLMKPDHFVGSIEKDDHEAFAEFLHFIESGSRAQAVIRMRGPADRNVFFSVSGSLDRGGKDEPRVKVVLQEIDADQWAKAIVSSSGGTKADLAEYRFDAILIDGTFLRPEPATWYKQFVDLLRAAKVIGPNDAAPKIFVLGDPKIEAELNHFRFKEIFDFSYRPVDRRQIVQKYLAFVPGLQPARDDGPPFVPCEVTAQLGKDVTMDELAEFGLSVVHPTAFNERSFMRFYSSLFGEDGGTWITGKCHSSIKRDGAENFRCQFMFYGPNDELLRRIRSWIREDYVAKKDQRSNSG